MNINKTKMSLVVSGAIFLAATSSSILAEEAASAASDSGAFAGMEEVVVLGRLRSSAEQLVHERMNEEAVMDILGAEMIGRIGDSTVAGALRRVPGLSLVDDKFIYVRGLGERYSSTRLNGAVVPSPDLTRNVIPLDIFPTAIVESLSVQKSYSPDISANFGGGAVDIRTKGIPDSFTWDLEIGTAKNSETSGSVLSHKGGKDDSLGEDDGSRALATRLKTALATYKGKLDTQNIYSKLQRDGANPSIEDARLVNRQLATALNRDISVDEKSVKPDFDIKASVGNNYYIGESWEFGFLGGVSYDNSWRETERLARNFNFPDERIDQKTESKRTVEIMSNLNFGLRYLDDHELSSTSLFLRNTDDITAIRDYHDENRELSDGLGNREYHLKFEQRDMYVNQLRGKHLFGQDTRALVPFLPLSWLAEEAELNWFYSDARAFTKIPSQVNVNAQTVTDTRTGAVLSSSVSLGGTSANYRFTDLKDDILSYGWSASIPVSFNNSELVMGFGHEYGRKYRTYRQQQFAIGALGVADSDILSGDLSGVFSDDNILDPLNNFVFDVTGTNNQSYIATTILTAYYGDVEWTWNDQWRVKAGARWEDYVQVALDWNVSAYDINNPAVTLDPQRLSDSVFRDDKYYPSVSLTYMGELWAEVFQLRFVYSETVIRPDLREITDASYIDPISGDLVDGNPDVVPSDISNVDIRAEWFFDSGDSFTVSLFYKDIKNPIEFFESAASDTNIAREIINAESAEVMGVEFEANKNLEFLGDFGQQFFLQGNITLLDSELIAGAAADAPTNDVRQLTNASDYVVNMVLGFDADNNKHSATVAYNVFGERLYVAGRNGTPDGFQQPFHSLDMSYFYYPTDEITVKFKLKNLLDEAYEIEREGLVVFEEHPGMTLSASFQYKF